MASDQQQAADAPKAQHSDVVAIEAKQVRKSYLSNEVLKGFDLEVPHGMSYGCAGVNGAGKSTFLKCMLDFCHYSSGSISIYGVPSTQRLSRTRLAFLPERFVPPYYLNGRNFIKMVMQLNSEHYSEQDARQMLDYLDLDLSALSKPVRSFSKGMTQKLGLAACFLLRRDLYILDEPMGGLDPKARALLKRQFKRLLADGATIFFTSHSLSDIEEVCEEMVLLDRGLVQFAGRPDDLRSKYGGGENSLEEAFLRLIQADTAAQDA
ncbi:MAG: ABC transporter ATP-binding protein [Betaproteobacteria bacterium]|nr:ABC transporter ATP-binding protein [Betaproteobacteria bacterium]